MTTTEAMKLLDDGVEFRPRLTDRVSVIRKVESNAILGESPYRLLTFNAEGICITNHPVVGYWIMVDEWIRIEEDEVKS